MTVFFLRSIELRESKRVVCTVLNVVDSNKLLVSICPTFPAGLYGQEGELDKLVLAPRYVGTSLHPEISEWPCVVNVCIPEDASNWDAGPWRLLDIAELLPEGFV